MKTRANQVAALLNNWSSAEKALDNSLNSAGTAAKENAIYLDSIEGRLSKLKASFEELSTTVVSSELVKTIISIGDAGLQGLNGFLSLSDYLMPADGKWGEYFNQLKALPSIIAAISAAVSIKNKGEADGILGIYNALCLGN